MYVTYEKYTATTDDKKYCISYCDRMSMFVEGTNIEDTEPVIEQYVASNLNTRANNIGKLVWYEFPEDSWEHKHRCTGYIVIEPIEQLIESVLDPKVPISTVETQIDQLDSVDLEILSDTWW